MSIMTTPVVIIVKCIIDIENKKPRIITIRGFCLNKNDKT